MGVGSPWPSGQSRPVPGARGEATLYRRQDGGRCENGRTRGEPNSVEWSLLRNEALQAAAGRQAQFGWIERNEYQQCMGGAGYAVEGFNAPEVAQSRFGQYRTGAEAPSAPEAQMALADFRCQQQIGLVDRLRDKYSEVAASWVLANAGRLRVWAVHMSDATRRAERVAGR